MKRLRVPIVALLMMLFAGPVYASGDSAAEPIPNEEQDEIDETIERESRLRVIPNHFRFRLTLDILNGINFVASKGVEISGDQFVAFQRFGLEGELPDIYPSIRAGKQIIVAQVFDKRKDAVNSLKRIPLPRNENGIILAPDDAEAFLGLGEGTFVSLPVRMSIRVGESLISSVSPDAGATLGFFLDTTFAVNVMRLQGSQVRVRMIAQNKKGIFADASLQLVSDVVGDIFNTEIIARGSREVGDVLAADYTFDLSNDGAKRAFEALLFPKYRFGEEYEEQLDRWGVKIRLVSDMTVADAEANAGNEAVQRNVRASARYKLSSTVLGLNAGVFGKFKSRSRSMTQNITILDSEDQRRHYLQHTNDYYKNLHLGGGPIKINEQVVNNNYIIVETDQAGTPLPRGFVEAGSTSLHVDHKMRKAEARRLKEFVRWNLPSELEDEIFAHDPWGGVYEKEKYRKMVARVNHKYDRAILSVIPNDRVLTYGVLLASFKKYLRTRGLRYETLHRENIRLKENMTDEMNREPGDDSNRPAAVKRHTKTYLKAILSLNSLETNSLTRERRNELGKSLKQFVKNPLALRFGYGFMMYLTGGLEAELGWQSQVSVKSEQFPEGVEFERGGLIRSEVVTQIRLAQEILHDTRWIRVATDLND